MTSRTRRWIALALAVAAAGLAGFVLGGALNGREATVSAAPVISDVAVTPVAAPSGQALALWQVSWERVAGSDGLQLVIRVLAPDLKSIAYDDAQADMDYICATHGVKLASLPYAGAAQVVVNLMDKPVQRGVTDPSAHQFFSVYRFEDLACIWEDL